MVGTEAIAVITGSFLSGAMMSVYLLAIPSLFENTTSPSHLLSHWNSIFYNGHRKGPGICLGTTALYLIAAYTKYSADGKWGIFAVAGVTTLGMVPFTLTVMAPTNNGLFRMEEASRKGEVPGWGDAERLVKRWNRLNVVRALFPLAGAVVGILGTLGLVSF